MPFLGKTPSQLVDPEVDIDGGTIDGVSIGSVTANAGAFTNLTATGTLTLPDDGISGDDVNGGTISNFASTGIDDNATSTQITLTNAATSVDNILKPASIKFNGATGITWEEIVSDVLYTRYGLSYGGNRLSFTYDGSTIARFLSSGEFEVYNDLTVDTDTLVVDSANNAVGIGDTAPDAKLTIKDAATASTDPTDPAHATLSLQYTSTKRLNIGDYSATPFASYIQSTNTNGTGFALALNPSGGNVGIGTNEPSQLLTVKKDTGNVYLDVARDTQSQGQVALQLGGGTGGTSWIMYQEASSDDLRFYGNGSNRMTLKSNGDVGIGVTPTNKLDIGGGITVQQAADIKWQNTARSATYGGVKSTASALSLTWNGSDALVVNSTGDVDIGGNLTAGNGSVDISMSATADGHIKIDGNGYDGAIALDATGMNIYHNSSSRGMFFGINETARMAISSGGDVGIGNTNPTGARAGSGYRHLDIKSDQVDVGGSLRLTNSDESSEFRIFNSDSVGTRLGTYSNNTLDIYTNSNFVARFDTSGHLLVGCTSDPSSSVKGMGYGNIAASGGDTSLVLSGGSYTGGDRQISFVNGNGTVGHITTSGSATAYGTTSDYRLKENVVSLDNATDRLKQIPVYRFNFIADPDTIVDGFLAHEVADFVPEAITGEKDAVDDEGNPVYQGIDQSKLVPLLTAAIQEQQAIIEDLQTRLSALEAN